MNCQLLQTTNETLKQQIYTLNKQLTTYLAATQKAELATHQMKLKLEMVGKNALIDQRVRAGQVKRVRVMEHQMKEVLAEAQKERQQRVKAEEHTVQLAKALNRERAQRLHDLHLKSKIASSSRAAAEREKVMESRCFSAENDLESISRTCGLLEMVAGAEERISIAESDVQMKQETAIEWRDANQIVLKSALYEARKDLLRMRFQNAGLRTEVRRLRTQIMQSNGSSLVPLTL